MQKKANSAWRRTYTGIVMRHSHIAATGTPAKLELFSGTPSQVINIPAFLKGFVVLVLVGAIDLYASIHALFHWPVALAHGIAIMTAAVLPCLKTAFTRIVIDTRRIRWEQGIFKRRTYSLELIRIKDVTTVKPWWQRLFGVGSIIIDTTDPRHPVRRLPGIKNPERLRDDLMRAAIALQHGAGGDASAAAGLDMVSE
jgi:membrane protein YdbS with pleckstrin-like domain